MASRKVLLIGWDAADWKVIRPLMEAGKMPNIQRLVESGASGEIATLHPPFSPMLWTSIATGKRPFQHGIHGFAEPTPDGRGVQLVTNLSRSCKALWNILHQNDLRSVVIGWWPSHPAEPIRGVMVSDQYHRATGPLEDEWPLAAGTVSPPELAGTLQGLRVHPESLTPELVERFIPRAREIDQDKDWHLALFLRTLAECMSIQAAALWLMENEPCDFFAVYYDALDHFSHGFMRYHPPRQSWVAARDFEFYRDVVSMAYQFHDQLLGSLLEKAGPETTVILMSDHGFHPDHLRPALIPDIPAGPAIEHRDLGILVIGGVGARKNFTLHAPSVLDIAPTVLTLFGLPVGEDMDGKVLSEAFADPPEVRFIASWENVPGDDGSHPPHTRLDPMAARASLEQMIALGYVERPDENRERAVARTTRELRFNLGEAYQDDGRHREAYSIFTELRAADPDEPRFAVRLFVSCQALGLVDEMRSIVEDLDGRCQNGAARLHPALVDYLKAQVFVTEERFPEALAALEHVSEAQLVRPGSFLQKADLYLRLGRRSEAREIYEKALAVDPDNAQPYVGLCRIAVRERRCEVAADAALNAIDKSDRDPLAHYLLGVALVGMREYGRAAEAFQSAIATNPNFPQAHVRLAVLLEKHLGDRERAREHRRLARQMRNGAPAHAHTVETRSAAVVSASPGRSPLPVGEMPPLSESLIVVSGLPRSGTSMIMQMLAAGGVEILTDQTREADEDNPRGYLEFEPVKNLLADSKWLLEARGKAVKIVVPLLTGLPPDLACRVVLCARDLDELLDSQEKMLLRRGQRGLTPERRQILKDEYARAFERTRAMLAGRARTKLLVVAHQQAILDPLTTAQQLDAFLGAALDIGKMAAAVEPSLHRNRGAATQPALAPVRHN